VKKKSRNRCPVCGARVVFGITDISEASPFIPPCAPSFLPTARREKTVSSPDRRRVDPRLSPPPRNLILPLQKCNRTIERSLLAKRRMAPQWQRGRPVARSATSFCDGPRGLVRLCSHVHACARAPAAACACSHTVAHLHAMHYACTPSSRRDAPCAPRRALSRTHARTHART